jgi:hypothetical protein
MHFSHLPLMSLLSNCLEETTFTKRIFGKILGPKWHLFCFTFYRIQVSRLQFTVNINRSGLQHRQSSGIKGEKP